MTLKSLKSINKSYRWNLKLLYSSIKDPRIESDVIEIEKLYKNFSDKWNKPEKIFISDDNILLEVLEEYLNIYSKNSPKPLLYLHYYLAIDSQNSEAQSLLNLLSNRITKASNQLTFFDIALGSIPKDKQRIILDNPKFIKFKFFLQCVFNDSKYLLSEPEEKILSLKKLTSSDMWEQGNEKIVSSITIKWKNKIIPLSEAQNMIKNLKYSDKIELSGRINLELKKASVFSEAELNALVTDKKIDDELRGFKTPSENTVRHYRNDPEVVSRVVEIVTKNFPVSHKFYKLKAKLLKQKNLQYFDRNSKVGKVSGDFSFESSKKTLEKVFGNFDIKYADILNSFIKNGQIDVYPKQGKRGGAFCSHSNEAPTFVLLNHINDFQSYTTFAHEMGHAFHSELTNANQIPLYTNYSTSLAEVASTFFENLAFEEVVKNLPKKQQIIALTEKINDDISTIFRQIACFNLENDIHNSIREKGALSKEEFAEKHNKHMGAYLGPVFKLTHDDGYFFVSWGHLRWFFYVYTYAYGQLVSKALMRKYKQDKTFISSIENYLKSGGKDSPENILKEIGLDVTTGKVFEEGIEEIKEDIKKLEKMMK